jgi:hypothetical protein
MDASAHVRGANRAGAGVRALRPGSDNYRLPFAAEGTGKGSRRGGEVGRGWRGCGRSREPNTTISAVSMPCKKLAMMLKPASTAAVVDPKNALMAAF